MVGHPVQRFIGATFPGQPVAMSYTHAAIAAAIQAPSHHILTQTGLTSYPYQQDIYGLLAKQQQHSPIVDQTNSVSAQPHDHPIGYGAFGVVW